MASKFSTNEEDGGSEEIVEMFCELCKKKGKDRTAEGFCVDCVKYFCEDCLGYHTEFLPDHVHKDRMGMPQDVCLNPCPNHSEEIIKFYCSTCNMFFCSECKKTDHKNCEDVRHLPDIVKDLENGAEYLELKGNIKTMEKESKGILTAQHKAKKSTETMSEKALSDIDALRDRLIEWVNDSISTVKSDLKTVEETELKTIQDNTSKLSASVSEISSMKYTMEQKIRESKRCELFMAMKNIQSKRKTVQKDLLQMKEHQLRKFHFEANKELVSLLETPIKLGKVTSRYTFMSSQVGEWSDVQTQKSFVANQLLKPLLIGDKWYIIDIKWFKQWKRYVGYDSSGDPDNVGDESAHPGTIDNTPVLQEGTTKLKEHLIEDSDYVLVPEEGWEKLVDWYGLKSGQEHLSRQVIEEDVYSESWKVAVYPWHLKLCENSNLDYTITKQMSRSVTINKLEEVMRREFSIPADKEVRLWIRFMTNVYAQVNKKRETIQDAGLSPGQVIVIEQKNLDGTWPRDKVETKDENK